jgi:VWFA-related protein
MGKILVSGSILKALTTALVLLFSVTSVSAQTNPSPSPTPSPRETPIEEIDPGDVIKVSTTLVNSPVLVIGRDGKYVPNLKREDFRLFEGEVEQKVAFFAPVSTPFTVAILLDTSRSSGFAHRDIQDAAISFIDDLRSNDQALVISFDDQTKVLTEATSDHDTLKSAVRAARPGGGTKLYDAINFVIKTRLDQMQGRKAIILLTDGVDTASEKASYASSLADIAKSDALVYPIQFDTYTYMKQQSGPKPRRDPPVGSGFSPLDYARADAYLHQLTEASGTALHPAANINDLDRAVASIVEELHNEYSIGYYPQSLAQPGEFRPIAVRVSRPQLTVRSRSGYGFDQKGNVILAPTATRSITPRPEVEIGALPTSRRSERDVPLPGARWVCKGPTVPGNYAVVRDGFDAICPSSKRANDETNAWFIKKPAATEIICKGYLLWNGSEIEAAPLPTGYALVGQLISNACAKSNDPDNAFNAWSIKLPASQETVCKGFQIPRGFVVIGEKTSTKCPGKSVKNAWLISRKSGPVPSLRTQ